MRKRLALAFTVAFVLAAGSSPAGAQGTHSQHSHNRSPHARHTRHQRHGGNSHTPRYIFIPGFGLRPVLHQQYPVTGLGFDSQHFHNVNRHRSFTHGTTPYPHSFGVNPHNSYPHNTHGVNRHNSYPHNTQGVFFGGASPGIYSVGTGTRVIVVRQTIPAQSTSTVVVPGPYALPAQNRQTAVVTQPAQSQQVLFPFAGGASGASPGDEPTLLVLKNNSLLAASDFWVENGRLVYVSSTGQEGSVALDALDLEATNQINGHRRVEDALRSAR